MSENEMNQGKKHKKGRGRKMKLTMPVIFALSALAVAVLVVLGITIGSLLGGGSQDQQAKASVTTEESAELAQSKEETKQPLTTSGNDALSDNDALAAASVSDGEASASENDASAKAEAVSKNESASKNEAISENEALAKEEGEEETKTEEETPVATATVQASNTSCVLLDAGTIQLSAVLGSEPATASESLCVYQLAPYQYGLDGARKVTETPKSASPVCSFPKESNGSIDGLYCKYVFATAEGAMLGEPQYITNPEILATNTRARVAYPPKGLADIFYNYNMDQEIGGNHLILQINNYGNNPAMKHPAANGGDSHPVDEGPFQYMFNAANAEGVNALANSMHNLAVTHITQDFIIGNEVNERKWCYVNYMDWDSYVREYMQGFRVAYNAIKSANANARVYICISQDWNRNRTPGETEYYYYIDARDFILKFNSMIKAGGNIDWCVSCHPHLVPLTYAKFWDMSGIAYGDYYASMVATDAMLSFQNLSTLTNFMQSGDLLSPSGRVRSMMASETGISAGQGADVQGAALYASYQACIRNPYIETMIYSPDPTINAVFTEKAAEVYNNMGGPNDAAYDAWAKSVIGISDWGQVLR